MRRRRRRRRRSETKRVQKIDRTVQKLPENLDVSKLSLNLESSLAVFSQSLAIIFSFQLQQKVCICIRKKEKRRNETV